MICIVVNSLGRGGAERSALLLLAELVRRGILVRLISLYRSDSEYRIPSELQGSVIRLDATSFARALMRLYSHLRHAQRPVIYSLMPQANISGVIVGRLLGLRVCSSERTTPIASYSTPKLLLALLPHLFSARAVFISHFALNHGLPQNALGRAVRRNACVLHNPVPSPVAVAVATERRNLRVQRLRKWCASSEDSPKLSLLLASRLVPSKGILEVLVATCELLRSARVHVTIAGTGPMQLQLEQFIDAEGLRDHVSLKGFSDDIWDEYARADVVLLSSKHEGFGRVGFEAYQAGCLLVGTRDNSFAEEIIPRPEAWQLMESFSSIEQALGSLAIRDIPENGSDIAAMGAELRVDVHANNFLNIVSAVSAHD